MLEIASMVTNVSHLTNSDVDLHLPCDVNYSYYSMDQFISNDDILQCLSDKNSFSAINCNIRSLSANYDKLVDMLAQFTSSFLVRDDAKFIVPPGRSKSIFNFKKSACPA